MAVSATFNAGTGFLQLLGDGQDEDVTLSRLITGEIQIDAGTVTIAGGVPAVFNTTTIAVFANGGRDTVTLNEANGALPAAQLFGGEGSDSLTSGSGADFLLGEAGNDVLSGSGGSDRILGGDGNDVITGGSGSDQLAGDAGNDRFVWNPGGDSDVVDGGADTDTLAVNGGAGAETFTVTANGLRFRVDRVNVAPFAIDAGTVERLELNAGDGNDTLSTIGNLTTIVQLSLDGGAGNDSVAGGTGTDALAGGDGNDTLAGQQGNDQASGGAGDDRFLWSPGDGDDGLKGDAGFDTLEFNGSAINEIMSISAVGGHARVTRDVAAIVLDLVTVEAVTLHLLAGTDRITVGDLRKTDLQRIDIDLSANATGAADGATDLVTLQGGSKDETVVIDLDVTTLRVQGLAAAFRIAASEVLDRISLATFGGDDGIDAGAVFAGLTNFTLDGGTGNDTVLGSRGGDVLIGGDGNDSVRGGPGNDTASLGIGDDVFAWGPGDGSDVVEGQDGADRLAFIGSDVAEQVTLSANGARALLTRDVAAVVLDINGIETLDIAVLGGGDQVTVNDLSVTGIQRVGIDLAGTAGAGDGATDLVVATGTNGIDTILLLREGGAQVVRGLAAEIAVTQAEATDGLTLNALGGDDVVDAGAWGKAMRLTLNGGFGIDRLTGSAGGDLLSGGDGNDLLFGGAGDDTAVWNPGDDNDVLEGQGGKDTLLFNGANINETIGILASGPRALFTRDVAAVTMDLNDVETIRFQALGGADAINIGNLQGTDLRTIVIDLAAAAGGGDGAADTITIDGTAGVDSITVASAADGSIHVTGLTAEVILLHAEAFDRLVVRGLGGSDVIDAQGLHLAIALTEDGGDGNDGLNGGDFADTLLGGLGDDALFGGPGFDILDGGPGTNVLIQ